MNVPRATYRLQFRDGMDFDRAATIVPYLKDLGVSHLYASPIFTATTGSTHGYDVTNHNEIDPALGGSEGFERLTAALRDAGLGLILDIVPNHMAASTENPWWRSVVEWGAASPYARHFDIDWSRRLTLPILGKPFEASLGDGDLGLAVDAGRGEIALTCPGHVLPLAPETYATALADAEGDAVAAIRAVAASATADDGSGFHDKVTAILHDSAAAAHVQHALDRVSRHTERLADLHERQPWQLMFWQRARSELSYRRFFEITGLAGVRVEDPDVFDDVHRLALDIVRSGKADGLRIDHVDGLADPKGYLDRLRDEAGPDTYIVVEKILERGERLPEDWPIQGTTGYEFIDCAAGLFCDPESAVILDSTYADLTGKPVDVEAMARDAKTAMVTHNFDAELSQLVQIASASANDALPPDALRAAIAELVVAFPVYRTYGRAGGMGQNDRALLARVTDIARKRLPDHDAAIGHVAALLEGNVPDPVRDEAGTFRARFQQLTGPVMAKAVEDTLFYRFNRLIPLNEVGGDPEPMKDGVGHFHVSMAERARSRPHALTATATHDTKRGEDARSRLFAITEEPGQWTAAVARWRSMHADHVRALSGGPAPEPKVEWMLYQALAGIWPAGDDLPDSGELERLSVRFEAYVQKSLREAKERTNWLKPDSTYEETVQAYARRLLSPASRDFHADFSAVLGNFVAAGTLNSLAQTLLKATAPGVPDIYQGSEIADYSLVDPDNRRPVDFSEAARLVGGAGTTNGLRFGKVTKAALIRGVLAARAARERLFGEGSYVPLDTQGNGRNHLIAFMRRVGNDIAIAIAPRLPMAILQDGVYDPGVWADTELVLPEDCAGLSLRGMVSGGRFVSAGTMPVAQLLRDYPMELLLPIGSEQ